MASRHRITHPCGSGKGAGFSVAWRLPGGAFQQGSPWRRRRGEIGEGQEWQREEAVEL